MNRVRNVPNRNKVHQEPVPREVSTKPMYKDDVTCDGASDVMLHHWTRTDTWHADQLNTSPLLTLFWSCLILHTPSLTHFHRHIRREADASKSRR